MLLSVQNVWSAYLAVNDLCIKMSLELERQLTELVHSYLQRQTPEGVCWRGKQSGTKLQHLPGGGECQW